MSNPSVSCYNLDMNDFHQRNTQEVLDSFEVNPQSGLTSQQIDVARAKYGENKLPEPARETFLKKLLKQIINPLVLILIAAFVLTIVLQEYVDALVIAIAVVVNVTVALVQEGRASQAYELLRSKRVFTALVIRDGKKQEVGLEELVPGDIVLLQSGMYVPADIRVLEATNITANQVAFTGESVSVFKTPEPSDTETIFERSSMLFAGSTIGSGSGLGVVTSIGSQTVFAGIAESLLAVEKDKSPIEKESEKIATILSVVAGVIVVFIVLLGLYRELPLYEMILLAVAVAVSSVPEGLPSAITAILAYGAARIGARGGLVKNLSSAQTLGSTDVIMTDKTGTLTNGLMDVTQIVGITKSEGDRALIAEHGLFATEVFFDEEHNKFVGDDVDQAIGRYFAEGGTYVNELLAQAPEHHIVPFDSRNKYFAAVRTWKDRETVFAKGAFRILWDHAELVLENGKHRPKTDADYTYFSELIDAQTKEGKRVLAVSHNYDCSPKEDPHDPYKILRGAVFCGILIMEDPIRESAAGAVGEAQSAGVEVLMITGDAANTARSIAFQSGIVDDTDAHVVYGDDLKQYSDDELFARIESGEFRIFSRVSPEHKLRLVDIFTTKGKTVAMTGDGVNDSLALSRASVGISLASATEVAKESADIILTNNSFAGIIFALKEGRRMASNISKTIVYLLSTSFLEVTVIVSALLLALPMPFLPAHILWANMLGEGVMNFAFLFEPNRNPQEKPHKILNKHVMKLTVGIGIVTGFVFLSFFMYLQFFTVYEHAMVQTMMFGALAFGTLFAAFSMRDLTKPFWKISFKSNRFFLWALCGNLTLFGLTIGTEIGRTLLHLEVLDTYQLGVLICFGVINMLVIEICKYVFKTKEDRVVIPTLANG